MFLLSVIYYGLILFKVLSSLLDFVEKCLSARWKIENQTKMYFKFSANASAACLLHGGKSMLDAK
jgi:hypothetical protein